MLMIIDRDAPSRADGGQRYWLHSYIVDVPVSVNPRNLHLIAIKKYSGMQCIQINGYADDLKKCQKYSLSL